MELLQQAGYPHKDIPSQGGRERRGWTTGQGPPFVLLCLPTNARGRSASHPANLCRLHLNSSPSPATEASRWDCGVPEYVCAVGPLEGNLFPGWGESLCGGGLPQAPLSSLHCSGVYPGSGAQTAWEFSGASCQEASRLW